VYCEYSPEGFCPLCYYCHSVRARDDLT
jgi:hypothetical protein